MANRLEKAGIARATLVATPGQHVFSPTNGALKAPTVLFMGTVRLGALGYHEIRFIARRTLNALEERPDVKHIVATVHGTSFGLDEDEAVLALAGGYIEAFQGGAGPRGLKRITIVDKNEGRAKRMRLALEGGLGRTPKVTPLTTGWGFSVARSPTFVAGPAMASAGVASVKPHAFVAMPFIPE